MMPLCVIVEEQNLLGSLGNLKGHIVERYLWGNFFETSCMQCMLGDCLETILDYLKTSLIMY